MECVLVDKISGTIWFTNQSLDSSEAAAGMCMLLQMYIYVYIIHIHKQHLLLTRHDMFHIIMIIIIWWCLCLYIMQIGLWMFSCAHICTFQKPLYAIANMQLIYKDKQQNARM